jgi:hypothetical protein
LSSPLFWGSGAMCVAEWSCSIVFGEHAASDVKSDGRRQGGLSGGGGSHNRRLAKQPTRLPHGSIEKGVRVRFTSLRLAAVPCRRP